MGTALQPAPGRGGGGRKGCVTGLRSTHCGSRDTWTCRRLPRLPTSPEQGLPPPLAGGDPRHRRVTPPDARSLTSLWTRRPLGPRRWWGNRGREQRVSQAGRAVAVLSQARSPPPRTHSWRRPPLTWTGVWRGPRGLDLRPSPPPGAQGQRQPRPLGRREAGERLDRAPGRTPRPPGAGSRQRRLGSTVSSDPSAGAPVCTQLPLPGDCPSSYRDARIPQAQAGVRLFPEAHPDSLPHHQPGLGETHARKATQVLCTHGSLSRQGPRFSASSHPPQRPVQFWAAPQGARDAEVRPSASCSTTPVHRSQDGGAGGPGTAGVSPRTAARGSTRGTGKAHTGTETPIPDGPRLCS